jgi:LysR family transcriptional regulator for metE and metH
VLRKLSAAHPGLDLQIAVEATRNPIQALLEGRLDVALCCFPALDRRLVETRLFEDELVVLLPAGHRLAERPFLRGEDLLGETVFSYELPPRDEKRLVRALFGELERRARFRPVPLTEAMIELVRAGHGISAIARWSLGAQLDRGDLVTRRIGRGGMRRPWTLVHPRSTPFQQELRTLAELLRTAVPNGG